MALKILVRGNAELGAGEYMGLGRAVVALEDRGLQLNPQHGVEELGEFFLLVRTCTCLYP